MGCEVDITISCYMTLHIVDSSYVTEAVYNVNKKIIYVNKIFTYYM